jgi:N-methylhydantoinase A
VSTKDDRRLRVGVDIGGTFTDLVVFDEADGGVRMAKAFSTPGELTRGIGAVLDEAAPSLEPAVRFVHGTTAGINAIVERKGARVGLLTTRGFRDTLEIMRINREHHYDLQWSKPVPLVPRRLRFEVDERVDYRGRVIAPLDEASVVRAVEAMRAEDVEAVAICFLFSFMNPDHERRAAEIVRREWPEVPVSVSFEILPEIREYERTSTVVIDAYVKPLLTSYFAELRDMLGGRGMASAPAIMGSAGGIVPVEEAAATPVKTIQSGPAGGIIGAAYLGRKIGRDRLIAIDVGGTSFEVGLIDGGEPGWTTSGAVEWGIPFKVPLVDVKSIGAGGGSIARVDSGGLLQVGPESAGADPGPACYGRGGTLPTLTDAYVATGVIDPAYFLGGAIELDAERARDAIAEHVGEPLGMSVHEAAHGILTVNRASMVGAMEEVSTQRGYDPRDYGLIAYGGAGPLVAAELAREMGMDEVIVPPFPGAFCAFGMLRADMRFDYVASYLARLDEIEPALLDRMAGRLAGRAAAALERTNHEGQRILTRTADLRYVGQNYEVTVPVPDGTIDAAAVAEVVRRFNDEHRRRFGHRKLDEPIEFVSLRLTGVGITEKPPATVPDSGRAAVPKGSREIVTASGERVDVPVYERDGLPIGEKLTGPLIVEEPDSTIVAGPDDTLGADQWGNLRLAIA